MTLTDEELWRKCVKTLCAAASLSCFSQMEQEQARKEEELMKKLLSMLLTLALVAALCVSAVAAEDWVKTPGEIEKWDREVDFLVVGYGLAGAAAAVEAYDIDPTAEILVLEKMPVELAGGNSIASGQTFLVPAQEAVETLKTYLYNCNRPNDIPDEYLTWLCQGFADQLP